VCDCPSLVKFKLSKRGDEDLIILCPLLSIFNENHWANFVWERHYLRLDNAPVLI
jgi:hypothetical protein